MTLLSLKLDLPHETINTLLNNLNNGDYFTASEAAGKIDKLRYGPYATTTIALSTIDSEYTRIKGLTVGILVSGSVVEYWFKDGLADIDFIQKSSGGSGGHVIQNEGVPVIVQPAFNIKGDLIQAINNAGNSSTDIIVSNPTGSQVSNVAAGSIVATDSQAAINELDSEKAPKVNASLSGDILLDGNISLGNTSAPTDPYYLLTLGKSGADNELLKRVDILPVQQTDIDSAVSILKGSVPVGGDTLNKLYDLIQGSYNVQKTYADITARDADTGNVVTGEHVFVTDASADSDVTSGWAIYRWSGSVYSMIQEQEGLNIDLSSKEDFLSNPATDNFGLVSTIAGVRSWTKVVQTLQDVCQLSGVTAYPINMNSADITILSNNRGVAFTGGAKLMGHSSLFDGGVLLRSGSGSVSRFGFMSNVGVIWGLIQIQSDEVFRMLDSAFALTRTKGAAGTEVDDYTTLAQHDTKTNKSDLATETDLGLNGTTLDVNNRQILRFKGEYTSDQTLTLSNVSEMVEFRAQIENTGTANELTFSGISMYFRKLPTGVLFSSGVMTFPDNTNIKYNLIGTLYDGVFDCDIKTRIA